jgi:hypothetical protein
LDCCKKVIILLSHACQKCVLLLRPSGEEKIDFRRQRFESEDSQPNSGVALETPQSSWQTAQLDRLLVQTINDNNIKRASLTCKRNQNATSRVSADPENTIDASRVSVEAETNADQCGLDVLQLSTEQLNSLVNKMFFG